MTLASLIPVTAHSASVQTASSMAVCSIGVTGIFCRIRILNDDEKRPECLVRTPPTLEKEIATPALAGDGWLFLLIVICDLASHSRYHCGTLSRKS